MDSGGADWRQQEEIECQLWHETEMKKDADMETIKIEGFIAKSPYGSGFTHIPVDMSEHGYITVCPHTIEVPMPADFNPIAAEVAALNKKLDKENEEHADRVKLIKDRIANLLCIEYTPATATETADDGLPF